MLFRSAYSSESFDAGAYRRISSKVNGLFDELKQLPLNSPRRAEILKEYPPEKLAMARSAVEALETNLRAIRGKVGIIENSAYQARLAGKIELAEKYEQQAVTYRNEEKQAERVLFGKMVEAANKAGFRREILGE